RVADYGSAGYRFESCRGHREVASQMQPFFIGIRQYICTTGIVRSIKPHRLHDSGEMSARLQRRVFIKEFGLFCKTFRRFK
ncbi:hypothetical protein, partial [Phocaeicola coprophilus]|uniref:hypothetical protein n=1 Tax=Phocaeicola coprophilus TaxID=387090 RepID=UPI0039F60934